MKKVGHSIRPYTTGILIPQSASAMVSSLLIILDCQKRIMFCAFLKFSQDIKAYTLKVPVTLQDTTTTRMMAVSTF